jgi:CHAT domain-containing protein
VLSLWEVDDQWTAELRAAFYRNLTAGKTKGDSLRDAQLELIQAGRPATDWAAFVLFGDPSNLGR